MDNTLENAKLIIEKGESMRRYQKLYFAERTDPEAKRQYLNESKRLERQFDNMVEQFNSTQKSLF